MRPKMSDLHLIFSLWNYSFLFITISTLCVFTVDMIGHKTKTISANLFTIAIVIGLVVGELGLMIGFFSDRNIQMTLAILLTTAVSIVIPLKYRTIDPEVIKSVRRFNAYPEE